MRSGGGGVVPYFFPQGEIKPFLCPVNEKSQTQNVLVLVLQLEVEVLLAQSCLTLCNPIDGSPPGSPVPGILQARTLEWVAIAFSNV